MNNQDEVRRLKEGIKSKLGDMLQTNEEKERVQEVIQREQWQMKLKTHIGKFQSEVLAFNIRKYFRRWKSKLNVP